MANLRRRTFSTPGPYKHCTAVVDTPMRKIELLETFEGELLIRAIELRATQAFVIPIHMNHPEAVKLADVIYDTEYDYETEMTCVGDGPISNNKDIVMCTGPITRESDYLECAHCGDLFKVRHKRRWLRDVDRVIEHIKRDHPKARATA